MGPVTYSFAELLQLKENGGVPKATLKFLRKEADEILTLPTLCVTNRKIQAPSGNPHDYMSVGRYWWPNPDTGDGLPYIQRDGIVNPDTQDENMMGPLADRIHILALAAFYFEDRKYSAYAECQLYDWFLNPDTRMNPHGRFAQAIPGICEGRCYGLIDFAEVNGLFDGIGVLEEIGGLHTETVAGVRAWYIEFVNWLLTNENGLEEDNTENNHGTWYDAQILAAATFTGRKQLAKKICTTSYARRMKKQIAPDGSQPHELKRTKGMNYSLYNMEAFSVISAIAERLGYHEYWGIDEDRGICILKSAVDFLYPYVIDPDSFPYQELYPQNSVDRMAKMLLRVDARYPNAGYAEKAAALIDGTVLWRLFPIK